MGTRHMLVADGQTRQQIGEGRVS